MALNATALNATAPSYGTIFPADAPLPTSSNLNYLPGQAPTPNKVDVKVSKDGRLAIFNKFGTVDMLADVAGYYVASSLQELDARVDQIGAMYHELVKDVQMKTEPAPLPRSYAANSSGISNLADTPTEVLQFVVTPERDGMLIVNSSALSSSLSADGETRCSITTGFELDSNALQIWQAGDGAAPHLGQLAGTRGIGIEAGVETTVRLICQRQGADIVNIANAQLTGTFTAQKINWPKAADISTTRSRAACHRPTSVACRSFRAPVPATL